MADRFLLEDSSGVLLLEDGFSLLLEGFPDLWPYQLTYITDHRAAYIIDHRRTYRST